MLADGNNFKFLKEAYDKGYRVDSQGCVLSPKGKPRKLFKSSMGYFQFSIGTYDGPKNVLVHQLQAYQKFGLAILENETIRHLDGNRENNALANLALGSHSDNTFDRSKEDRIISAINGAEKVRKLTREQWLLFCEDRRNGFTYKQLMAKYGLAKSTVSYIVNNKTYNYF
jgi:hypothetical protein